MLSTVTDLSFLSQLGTWFDKHVFQILTVDDGECSERDEAEGDADELEDASYEEFLPPVKKLKTDCNSGLDCNLDPELHLDQLQIPSLGNSGITNQTDLQDQAAFDANLPVLGKVEYKNCKKAVKQ